MSRVLEMPHQHQSSMQQWMPAHPPPPVPQVFMPQGHVPQGMPSAPFAQAPQNDMAWSQFSPAGYPGCSMTPAPTTAPWPAALDQNKQQIDHFQSLIMLYLVQKNGGMNGQRPDLQSRSSDGTSSDTPLVHFHGKRSSPDGDSSNQAEGADTSASSKVARSDSASDSVEGSSLDGSKRKKKKKKHRKSKEKQLVNLYPRRKKTEEHRSRDHMIISLEQIKPLFQLPLKQAATKLGICTTAFKSVCRKLGLKQWPYKLLKQAGTNNECIAMLLQNEMACAKPDE